MLELFLLTTKQILGSNDHPLVDDILKDLVPFANSANEQLPIILGTLDEHLMATTSLTPEMKLKAFTTFIETYFYGPALPAGWNKL
ncbi:hypothetical protein H4R35_007357 [Dimargaris xerosporica]|nr:hypothetical protein H4R35_007357 [Dimargaris xerosporica]